MGKIKQSEGESNKLWGLLKSLGYSIRNVSSRVVLEENGTKVFEPRSIASIFNSFYTTVAAKLVSLLPNIVASANHGAFREFYHHKIGSPDLFILTPVTTD